MYTILLQHLVPVSITKAFFFILFCVALHSQNYTFTYFTESVFTLVYRKRKLTRFIYFCFSCFIDVCVAYDFNRNCLCSADLTENELQICKSAITEFKFNSFFVSFCSHHRYPYLASCAVNTTKKEQTGIFSHDMYEYNFAFVWIIIIIAPKKK